MKRVLTAAALIPVIVYTVLWAHFWVFFAVLAAVALLCYREYSGIAAGYGFGKLGPVGYAAGLVLLLVRNDAWLVAAVLACSVLALAMRSENPAQGMPRAALAITGVIYIFGCWKCAIPMREANPHWLMYGLMVSWAGDIGAYYVGQRFGRHKMAPRVSPKKSWEGAAASVATSILIAGAYLAYFVPGTSIPAAIALTAGANAAGQLGDLAESALKRGAGVKDSGTILPGHGGFLDRVDSTLFALPLVYCWLKLAL